MLSLRRQGSLPVLLSTEQVEQLRANLEAAGDEADLLAHRARHADRAKINALTNARDCAHAEEIAGRDEAIHLAITVGAEPSEVAEATGLTVDEVRTIWRNQ